MTPDEIRKLKKVDKAAPSTAAERLKKLNPKAELPLAGGEGSGSEGFEYVQKLREEYKRQGQESAARYPDVCTKCGAPSGPGGCSLSTETEPLGTIFVSGENGERLKFENQCDELAEFTRLQAATSRCPICKMLGITEDGVFKCHEDRGPESYHQQFVRGNAKR